MIIKISRLGVEIKSLGTGFSFYGVILNIKKFFLTRILHEN